MTNSRYIGITFLLYFGSGILFGVVGSAIVGFPTDVFYVIGIISALFSWFIFFLAKILPTMSGKNGLNICLLCFCGSSIYLIPVLWISYFIIDGNVYDTSHPSSHRFSSSSKDVWDNKPGSIRNSAANSDKINTIREVLSDTSFHSRSQNDLDNQKLEINDLKNTTYDFGFSTISNEEIIARFDEIHLHTKLKIEIHNQLAKWIDEQARIRGLFIPYPDIFLKTEEFVNLNM
ncbi:hypothetical protein DSAG12_03348 [Promethearchaeum syntrophicum]|uniref:Uncharacterized protein n=1 Tax=Promethearchaeum syntrophicum TaxID=2594042 RepID=A0A5B9DES7_9ARCH|nr:hypothetical protein [Candidatus Prometheoarchaeum syntrophicum]QEE17511.1 hypothetical protein DSAG12_03348 [Candidatus Prometheoarchaeum syntrophicum]